MLKNQIVSIFGGVLATCLSYGAGLYFGWIDTIDPLEAFAVFTSYWCTILCVFQTRWNYPIGAISVAALCLLFYKQNLLASMALQIYLFPTLLVGWIWWHKDEITRPVTTMTIPGWMIYLIPTAILGVGLMEINLRLGGANAFWDTSVLMLSILAQFMLDRKKLENWIVWIVVDIISVFLYWNQDLKIVAIQMGVFILTAIWGLWSWYNTMEKETELKISNSL